MARVDEPDRRAAVERAVASCLERGDHRGAFEAGVRGYGPEVLGYLVGVLHDETAARDVYAELLEQLWKGLPRFARASSFRTWTYAIAFRLAARQRRRTRRRRESPLAESNDWLSPSTRASTARYLRTEAKDWLARERAALAASERSLLILRVDRGLSWDEVASVTGVSADVSKKRFERLKKRLKESARRQPVAP